MKNTRKDEILRIAKFLFFSASAGVIQILSFTLLNELSGWSYWPCYLISLVLSVVWNFTLNRNSRSSRPQTSPPRWRRCSVIT